MPISANIGSAGKKSHVLMTVNASWNIWNFRKSLVQALLASGHRVTILAPTDETVIKLTTLGARHVPLDMDVRGLGLFSNLRLIGHFKLHFAHLKPDIVLSYTIKNNIFGAIAARSSAIPFLPNVTGLGTVFLGSRAMFWAGNAMYRFAMKKLPVVFIQNGDDHDFLVSNKLLRPEQLRILPGSGINLDDFSASTLPESEGGTTFLMISRLIRDKGVMEYLNAARAVRAIDPTCVFHLLGPLGAKNRTAIGESELQSFIEDGSVKYLGETDDVRPFVEAAHCVVLPSYREGAPRTLIEAAAMGRPIITTDVPGCRAVVDDGETGLLCQVRDATSLAQSCLRFAAMSTSQKEVMGESGREKMVAEFDVSIVIQAYFDAMAEV